MDVTYREAMDGFRSGLGDNEQRSMQSDMSVPVLGTKVTGPRQGPDLSVLAP